MRLSTALSFALVLLPALQVSASPYQHSRANQNGNLPAKGGKSTGDSKPVASPSGTTPAATGTPKVNAANNNGGGNKGGNNGGGGGNNGGGNTGGGNTGGGNNGGGNNGGGNNGGNNNQDPQQSLTLDPRVLCKGCEQDGQNPPVAGQVASQTSVNNFINLCMTVPNLPITNGQQVQGGSCNPVPMGVIPSSDKIPSAKFQFPKNGQQIPANQPFTIKMAINNLVTGNFVNAQASYFAAPQQLQNGVIKGHSHVTIEKLTSLDQTTPLNPKQFAFFKGLNDAAQGGVLSTTVANGLPAGSYRMCSINTASNHQPCLVPIAQHGSVDDCSYFECVDGGANNGGGNNGGNNGGANNGGNNGGGNNGGNNGGANNGGGNNGGANNGGANNGGANNGGANNGGGNKGGANNGGANNGGANNGGGNKGGANNGGGNKGGANNGSPSPSVSSPPASNSTPAASGGGKNNGGKNNGGKNGGPTPSISSPPASKSTPAASGGGKNGGAGGGNKGGK